MFSVFLLVSAASLAGLWMMVRPRTLCMMAERRLARLAQRKVRRPDYFAINFTRLAGFFILMFAVLLATETIIKIVQGRT